MKNYIGFCLVPLALMGGSAHAATLFDLETVAIGNYAGGFSIAENGLTMTITTEGLPNGVIQLNDPMIALLGKRAVTGSQTTAMISGGFLPLRYSFSQAVDSVTFDYGDLGGDNDSLMTINAFDASGRFLAAITDTVPISSRTGQTKTIIAPGAAYFIASSGSQVGNPNSIYWNVSAYTLSSIGSVPEPENWALFIAGFGAIGMTIRRQSRKILHNA
jgi:hypothetical protein